MNSSIAPIRPLVAALIMASIALVTGGCASEPTPAPWLGGQQIHEHQQTEHRQPATLVFQGETLRSQAYARGIDEAQGPVMWYESRRDYRPNVIVGYQAPTLETVYTRTHDRESFNNGRSHHHYHHNAYRRRVQQIVR